MDTDLKELEAGKVPNGMKPFKVCFQADARDEKFSAAGGEVEINFPADCTISIAKELLHLHFMKFNTLMDKEMEGHRHKSLVESTSVESFIRDL